MKLSECQYMCLMHVHYPFFIPITGIFIIRKPQDRFNWKMDYYPVSSFPCFWKLKLHDYGIMYDPSKQPLWAWGFYQGNTKCFCSFFTNWSACKKNNHMVLSLGKFNHSEWTQKWGYYIEKQRTPTPFKIVLKIIYLPLSLSAPCQIQTAV